MRESRGASACRLPAGRPLAQRQEAARPGGLRVRQPSRGGGGPRLGAHVVRTAAVASFAAIHWNDAGGEVLFFRTACAATRSRGAPKTVARRFRRRRRCILPAHAPDRRLQPSPPAVAAPRRPLPQARAAAGLPAGGSDVAARRVQLRAGGVSGHRGGAADVCSICSTGRCFTRLPEAARRLQLRAGGASAAFLVSAAVPGWPWPCLPTESSISSSRGEEALPVRFVHPPPPASGRCSAARILQPNTHAAPLPNPWSLP